MDSTIIYMVVPMVISLRRLFNVTKFPTSIMFPTDNLDLQPVNKNEWINSILLVAAGEDTARRLVISLWRLFNFTQFHTSIMSHTSTMFHPQYPAHLFPTRDKEGAEEGDSFTMYPGTCRLALPTAEYYNIGFTRGRVTTQSRMSHLRSYGFRMIPATAVEERVKNNHAHRIYVSPCITRTCGDLEQQTG